MRSTVTTHERHSEHLRVADIVVICSRAMEVDMLAEPDGFLTTRQLKSSSRVKSYSAQDVRRSKSVTFSLARCLAES